MADLTTTTDAFAAPAQPLAVEHTYTPTHAEVIDGKVTMWGCARDADQAMFVAKRTGPKGKVRYIAAGTVARYLQLLALEPAAETDES